MKIILCVAALFSTLSPACAQNNNRSSLLEEAKTQLAQSSVSTILSSEKYLSLHPDTRFRELIKEHATTAILKIAPDSEPGKKIVVKGIIQDGSGQPVAGALVYMYQTDAKGWYAASSPHVGGNAGDMEHARLFGYVLTDAAGKFELHTIKPSGYPQSDLPAHIHVHVWANGYNNFVNEFLFDDDERLVGDIREQSIRNRFLISKPEKTNDIFDQQFSYKIILRK